MTARELLEMRQAGKITDQNFIIEAYKLMTPEQRERLIAQAREIYQANGDTWPEEGVSA